jgi:DNA-binding protein H-NS
MTEYKELLLQRQALDAQIAEARKSELAGAIAQARQLVQEFGLTSQDIFGGARQSKAKGSTVAPKYRDPATGATWTGRGKAPKWIADKDREQFLIAD